MRNHGSRYLPLLYLLACGVDGTPVLTGETTSNGSAPQDSDDASTTTGTSSMPSGSSSSADDAESSTSRSGSDGTGTSPPPMDCEIRQHAPDGSVGGFSDLVAECEDGFPVAIHRPSDRECQPSASAPACSQPGGECEADADCDALVGGGLCASLDGTGGGCRCLKDCATDDDCPADRACLCRSAVILDGSPSPIVGYTACWPADCREDSECGSDGRCALPNPLTVCSFDHRLACRGPGSGCLSDATCAPAAGCGHAPSGIGWSCVEGSCQ